MILLIIKLLLAQVKQMTQHQKQMQQINRPRLSVSFDFSFHQVYKTLENRYFSFLALDGNPF